MSKEIPTIVKLNDLREAIDSYKNKIYEIKLNSFDLWELKSDEHFENYFNVTTDAMGHQYINGIKITHTAKSPRGSYYFKTKL